MEDGSLDKPGMTTKMVAGTGMAALAKLGMTARSVAEGGEGGDGGVLPPHRGSPEGG
jgi:hypothetical protein